MKPFDSVSLPDASALPSWEVNPRILVSWWEMIQYGSMIASAVSNLRDCEWNLSRYITKEQRLHGGDVGSLHYYDEGVERMTAALRQIRTLCQTVDLDAALAQTNRILDLLGKQEGSAVDLIARVRSLHETLMDQLEGRKFLYLPKAREQFYEAQSLFGSKVEDSFPSTSRDIAEAGNCLALNRPNAAVYHSLCVLEVGIDSLAHALQLQQSMKDWHSVLREIEAAVGNISPNDGPAWKEDKQFYSKVVQEFRFFKDAWRNATMHGRANYNWDEARLIFDHVKEFMNYLAPRLKERAK